MMYATCTFAGAEKAFIVPFIASLMISVVLVLVFVAGIHIDRFGPLVKDHAWYPAGIPNTTNRPGGDDCKTCGLPKDGIDEAVFGKASAPPRLEHPTTNA